MSSITPFSDPSVPVESTSEMAEVITLSDDDDVIPLTPRQPMIPRINVPPNQPTSSQATVHIGHISKLNLEDLQGPNRRFSDIGVIRNQAVLHADLGNGLSHQNWARRSIGPPGVRPTPIIRRPVIENPVPTKRPMPTVIHTVPSTSTTYRSRREQAAAAAIYKGHYMFEATEGYEPSRRNTRHNTKKIDGKFVCTYNPIKCYKLFSSTVDVINHAWAHATFDPPPHLDRSKKVPSAPTTSTFEEELLAGEGSQSVLSDNSRMCLLKLQACEYCLAPFDTIYAKQQHVTTCHLTPDTVETVCNICELDMVDPIKMAVHMKLHQPGDAPYHCRKCKYRTSVRKFYFQHFADRHANEQLFCPICLYQEDLRPNTRRSKNIFVRSFFDHMLKHVTNVQYRCKMCALSFNEIDELNEHRQNDHSALNPLWQTNDRPKVRGKIHPKVTKKIKIANLQKKFFETQEGKRIVDEVAKGGEERSGFDLTTSGPTLYECSCGEFKSYNGNRTASHFHRCRSVIKFKDIYRDRDSNRTEKDPEDELKLFAVYPPMTGTEEEAKRIQDEINAETYEKTLLKIRKDVLEMDPMPINDALFLKMMADKVDGLDDIITECFNNLKNDDDD